MKLFLFIVYNFVLVYSSYYFGRNEVRQDFISLGEGIDIRAKHVIEQFDKDRKWERTDWEKEIKKY